MTIVILLKCLYKEGKRLYRAKTLNMKIYIKLLPPYIKKGKPDELKVQLQQHSVELQQLALYLSREWKGSLNYALVDDEKLANAEFMVNGKHVYPEYELSDGDRVTVLPYVGGG